MIEAVERYPRANTILGLSQHPRITTTVTRISSQVSNPPLIVSTFFSEALIHPFFKYYKTKRNLDNKIYKACTYYHDRNRELELDFSSKRKKEKRKEHAAPFNR